MLVSCTQALFWLPRVVNTIPGWVLCCPITDPGPNFSPAPLLRQAAAGSRLLLLCPAGVTRRRRRGGVANLPLPAQLLGMDKKSFELWSLPLISAWGRPRCCPPASKAPPGFCPPAVARPLDSQLIFFLPAPAAQSRSRGRAFFFFFLSRPVPTSWGRAGHWVSGCRRCVSCEMKR